MARPSAAVTRYAPLALLGLGLVAFFALGGQRYVSFEALGQHRESLAAWVAAHPLAAPLLYVVLYATAIAVSVPGGVVLTVTAGFLFGTVLGGFCALVGASIGATATFLAARTALRDLLKAKAGTTLQRMENGFRRDAFSYLLVLRLVPLFPFFLVNLVPALLGVPLRTYVAATLIGIIPGTFVFASVGNGLGAVLDAGGSPNLGIIFTPPVLLPILGLAVLALVPIVYKRVRGEPG